MYGVCEMSVECDICTSTITNGYAYKFKHPRILGDFYVCDECHDLVDYAEEFKVDDEKPATDV